MANMFDKGDSVEIKSGEYSGIIARVVALQEVGSSYQYGLSGVPGLNGDLYSVHERDIKKSESGKPVVAKLNSTANSTPPADQPAGNRLAEQLQQVADLALQSETETDSKYGMILERLEEIDKRMEVKEIKVVVEVKHTYNRKPREFATYSDEDRLVEDVKVADRRQLNFFEGEEE